MTMLGDAIRKRREEQFLSQRELANMCNISTSYLADVELGRRLIKKDETLRLLAEALSWPEDYPAYLVGTWPKDIREAQIGADLFREAYTAFVQTLEPRGRDYKDNIVRFLEYCHTDMHNWWELGVMYDWDMNPGRGKVWCFKDCSGFQMKDLTLEGLIAEVRRMQHSGD